MLSKFPRMTAAAVLEVIAVSAPAANAGPETVVVLSTGTFYSFDYTGNKMSCTGTTTKNCTHSWDATTCFESVGGTGIYTFCDANGGGQTRGTGTTGGACTTTNINPRLPGSITVESFYGSYQVPVDIVQTNGQGVFRGSLTTTTRTITVNGSFRTVGIDGGPCTFAARGDFQGTFTVSTPV